MEFGFCEGRGTTTARLAERRSTVLREEVRFIPKPWNNTMLRSSSTSPSRPSRLEEENRRTVRALRWQLQFIRSLERDFPYLAALARQEEAELVLAQADRAGDE